MTLIVILALVALICAALSFVPRLEILLRVAVLVLALAVVVGAVGTGELG